MEDTLENSKDGTGCHSTRLFFTPLLFSSQYFLFWAFSFSIIITKLREAVPAALRIQWLILTHYTGNTSEYSTHGLLGKLSALVLKPSWDAEKFSIFFFFKTNTLRKKQKTTDSSMPNYPFQRKRVSRFKRTVIKSHDTKWFKPDALDTDILSWNSHRSPSGLI